MHVCAMGHAPSSRFCSVTRPMYRGNDLAENIALEEDMRRAEQRVLEASRAEAEQRERQHDAHIKELEEAVH